MRIPVKGQLNNSIPALDLSTENKLIWFEKKGTGKPFNIIMLSIFITPILSLMWVLMVNDNVQYDKYNIYRDFGQSNFILSFVISIIFGVIGYVWSLFVYDSQKNKKITLKDSIELYKRTPVISKDDQQALLSIKKDTWWALPLVILIIGLVFWILLKMEGYIFFSGLILGAGLIIVSIFVWFILYYPTTYFARRYLDKKFSIKPRKK